MTMTRRCEEHAGTAIHRAALLLLALQSCGALENSGGKSAVKEKRIDGYVKRLARLA